MKKGPNIAAVEKALRDIEYIKKVLELLLTTLKEASG